MTETVHPRTDTGTAAEQAAAAAEGTGRLDDAAAAALVQEADTGTLATLAHRARCRRVDADRVTYLVDRNVNYTNACVTDCQFCGFYRPPGHAEVWTLDRDQLREKFRELRDIGGSRVLLQGGHNPDLGLDWYLDLLAWWREEFPELQRDCFSPSEIGHLADLEGLTREDVLRRLQEAGMQGLPGGGAEMLVDRVRREISPKKQSADDWLDTMRIAQGLGMTTSATQVIGFQETPAERVEHLRRLRDLQDESLRTHGNGFRAFIMWTVQAEFGSSLARSKNRGRWGAGGLTYLRWLAVCRLYLDNFDHLQASWPTQGEGVAQAALHFGADDFGSTMMEENVVSQAADTIRSQSVERLLGIIREAGFTPARRDSDYRILDADSPIDG